jgi:hypothetical protein
MWICIVFLDLNLGASGKFGRNGMMESKGKCWKEQGGSNAKARL